MSCFEEVIVDSPNIKYKDDSIEALYDYHFSKVEVNEGKLIVSMLLIFKKCYFTFFSSKR